ncbi:inorganic phosphate transporter [Zafaria cholistanensis]|uniref:Inorganic phosphate transporter n=1 Tax=Zafaria cholistanensis TaxID=1682741 RepID=A0A5A7NTZ5_9MICC|nr:inorganic phosphate transporter [Zafaria cholistanensis]GER24086.1 inorganic phosphate transporter [Zafaria cholistanensis]
MEQLLLGLVLAATCAYAFLNGFRDVSNSVASAVRTRSLTPTIAVLVAAFFAFVGTMLSQAFGTYLVSAVDLNVPGRSLGLAVMLSGLVAAGGWGLFCWWRGIPTSSTQAVISALAGSSGASALLLGGDGVQGALRMLLLGVGLPLLITPLVAYAASFALVASATWLARNSSSDDVNAWGRAAQSISACAVSLGHGLQDGQRTGALLTLALVTGNAVQPGTYPLAAQLTGGFFLAAGALFGGWRISHTIAYRLVSIDALRGATAQAVSASMLFMGALVMHLPLSTTQAVTSSIVGAGANQRFESIMWRNVLRVLSYWLAAPVTCAVLGGVLFLALSPLLGRS